LALKELEEWFDAGKEIRGIANPNPFFERTSKLAFRRLKREIERRGTLGEFAATAGSPHLERIPRKECGLLIFSGVMCRVPLRSPAKLSRRRVLCRVPGSREARKNQHNRDAPADDRGVFSMIALVYADPLYHAFEDPATSAFVVGWLLPSCRRSNPKPRFPDYSSGASLSRR
jgi:hypothetical protein